MVTAAGIYVFLLGLASGTALLTMSAFRRVSPRWLKWLLLFTGVLMIGRYVTLALYTTIDAPQRFPSWLKHCWLFSSVGLTLPGVMAIDQLLRHPGMSPKKLLTWFSPFLAAYTAVILFGPLTPVPDRVVGWTLTLAPEWTGALLVVQAAFVVGFVGICVMLVRKIPSPPIRSALVGLALAYIYLGADGVLVALGRWYFRPFLLSEVFAMLALWRAYDISAALNN